MDTSAMPRPETNAGDDDWAERWGRRIGAVLGPLLLVLAAFWLIRHLVSGAPAP